MLKPFWVKKKNIDKQLLPEFSSDDEGLILGIGEDGKIVSVDPGDLSEVSYTVKNMLTQWGDGVFSSTRSLISISGSNWIYDVWPLPFVISASLDNLETLFATGSFSISFRSAPAGYYNPFEHKNIDVHLAAPGFGVTLPSSGVGGAYRVVYIDNIPGLTVGLYVLSAFFDSDSQSLTIHFHAV